MGVAAFGQCVRAFFLLRQWRVQLADWRTGRFVDVTEAVRKGERGVVMRGW